MKELKPLIIMKGFKHNLVHVWMQDGDTKTGFSLMIAHKQNPSIHFDGFGLYVVLQTITLVIIRLRPNDYILTFIQKSRIINSYSKVALVKLMYDV